MGQKPGRSRAKLDLGLLLQLLLLLLHQMLLLLLQALLPLLLERLPLLQLLICNCCCWSCCWAGANRCCCSGCTWAIWGVSGAAIAVVVTNVRDNAASADLVNGGFSFIGRLIAVRPGAGATRASVNEARPAAHS